jgi:Na+-transporting NADH:ubiquinone oxidoreductase subunit NqrE
MNAALIVGVVSEIAISGPTNHTIMHAKFITHSTIRRIVPISNLSNIRYIGILSAMVEDFHIDILSVVGCRVSILYLARYNINTSAPQLKRI